MFHVGKLINPKAKKVSPTTSPFRFNGQNVDPNDLTFIPSESGAFHSIKTRTKDEPSDEVSPQDASPPLPTRAICSR